MNAELQNLDVIASLTDMWSLALSIPKDSIAVDSDFIGLGGDSLKAMLVFKMMSNKDLIISPRAYAQCRTIKDVIANLEKDGAVERDQGLAWEGALTGEQIWLFENKSFNYNKFNISLLYQVKGELNSDRLNRAIATLVKQHESLRTVFYQQGDQWFAKVKPAPETFYVTQHVIQATEEEQQNNLFRQACINYSNQLNINNGPLFNVVHFIYENGEPERILFVLHHTVADGMSFSNMVADIIRYYQSEGDGKTPQVAQPQQILGQLKSYFERNEQHPQLLQYANKLQSYSIAFPFDSSIKNVQESSTTRDVVAKVDEDLVGRLEQQVAPAHSTQLMSLVQAGLFHAIARWTGSNEVCINIIDSARKLYASKFDMDTSASVGWVVLSIPTSIDVSTFTAEDTLIKMQAAKDPGEECALWSMYRYNKGLNTINVPGEFKVVYNHVGDIEDAIQLSKDLKLQRIHEDTGDVQDAKASRTCIIYILSYFEQNSLKFHFYYSHTQFLESTVENLSQTFLAELAIF